MQVGLKTGTANTLTPSGLKRGTSVNHTQAVNKPGRTNDSARSDFPESPLLSTRPVRYNIQLNQQLTSVQKADSYLSRIENQLLQLRHTINGSAGRDSSAINEQANELSTLLSRREKLSGGTVDRQMNAVLEGSTKVKFSMRGVDAMLQNEESETLIFSLGGPKRELAAVHIEEDSSANQILRTLNLALGRFNVHGQMEKQQVVFSADEAQWPRLRDHLSARGEGHRYPEGQFFPVKLVAEPTLEDTVNEIVAAPATARKKAADFQQALDQVTLQRRMLTQHKENVNQRIEGMATFQDHGTALHAAELLKATIGSAGESYTLLLQVTAGQANIRSTTVKNLLG